MCKKLTNAVLTVAKALHALNRTLGRLIMAVSAGVEAIAAWGSDWRTVALAERAAKEAAQAAATEAGAALTSANQALADFQANDASTDASQIAEALAAADQAAQDRLAELKAGDPATDDEGAPTEDPQPAPPFEE
jgi:hypothetical protein